MKITTRAVFQMTENIGEYIPLEEESYEYDGPVAQAGKSGGSSAGEEAAARELAITGAMSRKMSDKMFKKSGQMDEKWTTFFDEDIMGQLDKVMDMNQGAMKDWYAQSEETLGRYNELFKPLEDSLARDAATYAQPWRKEQKAGEAAADVGQAFEAERENARKRLEDYGVDPSQTRAAAIDADVSMNEALGKAGAMNAARRGVDMQADLYRAQAIDMNMANKAASQTEFAQGLGQQGLAAQGSVANIGKSLLGSGLDYTAQGAGLLGSNVNSNQSMASIAGAGAQRAQAADNANTQAAAGIAAAAIAAFAADGGSVDSMRSAIPTVYAGGMKRRYPMVGQYAEGGEIEGPGGPREDAIPAQLSDGEFVVPADVVKRKGTEFFERMVSKEKEATAVSEMEQRNKQEDAQNMRTNAMQEVGGMIQAQMAQQQGIPTDGIPQQMAYGGYVSPTAVPMANGGNVLGGQGNTVTIQDLKRKVKKTGPITITNDKSGGAIGDPQAGGYAGPMAHLRFGQSGGDWEPPEGYYAEGGIVSPTGDIARAIPEYNAATQTQYLAKGGLGQMFKDVLSPKNLVNPKHMIKTTKKYGNPMAPFQRDDAMNPMQLAFGDSAQVQQEQMFNDIYNDIEQ